MSNLETCALAGCGRSVSLGVFFEPVAGSVQIPEIASSIPRESSPDGRSWIWSAEPTLSGAVRLGPRVGSWAVDITIPGYESGPDATSVNAEIKIGATSVTDVINVKEIVTLSVRPTATQSLPSTVVLTNSTACPLPNDGRLVHVFIGIRAVDPEAV